MVIAPDDRKVDWVRSAIQCVASADENSIVVGEAAGWGAGPLRSKPDPGKFLPVYGLHNHDEPEVCFALQGSATITVGERVYSMTPPRMALLSPRVMHAEGFARRQQPYVVMWLHYCTNNSFIALVSEYRPAGGWRVAARYALRSRAVRSLLGKLSSGTPAGPEAFEPIRADLFAILTEMNRRNVYNGDGKNGRSERPAYEDVLERVREYLDRNYATPIDVHTVAALTRFTPNYLNSLFSRWAGQGIHEYLISLRMRRAMELCRGGELLVKEVAQQLGYSDPLYFSRAFRRYHGCWPTDAGARALQNPST
jgi:AraC-like DNA-binding protein